LHRNRGVSNPELEVRLNALERDALAIATAEPLASFSYAGALLAELAGAHEWDLLRVQAERHVDSADRPVAVQAKRMLALSLAHSPDAADQATATGIYQTLIQENLSEAIDIGNLVTLLVNASNFKEAKLVTLDSIEKFPAKAADYLFEVGLRIVEATGDRGFRKQLEAAVAARGKRD